MSVELFIVLISLAILTSLWPFIKLTKRDGDYSCLRYRYLKAEVIKYRTGKEDLDQPSSKRYEYNINGMDTWDEDVAISMLGRLDKYQEKCPPLEEDGFEYLYMIVLCIASTAAIVFGASFLDNLFYWLVDTAQHVWRIAEAIWAVGNA